MVYYTCPREDRKGHPMELHQYISDVEALTIRHVPGDGDQLQLLVRTRAGTLVLRLIGRRGRVIRVSDLRHRDKRRGKRERFVSVPITDVFPVEKT
jgi:hypothetical protein